MQKRARENPRIEFAWNSVVEEVRDVAANQVTSLQLRDVTDNSKRDLEVQGLFLAIGHTPNTGFLNGQIDLDVNGFVLVQEPTSRTSVEGVFACGDVMDPIYRQAVTAAGTGCMAAIDAERWLAERG